jgi:hypothetical protein
LKLEYVNLAKRRGVKEHHHHYHKAIEKRSDKGGMQKLAEITGKTLFRTF